MPWLIVMYDIADDRRRTALSALLSEHGPRVQLSVFEVEYRTSTDKTRLCRAIADIIEPQEDQVRLYELPTLSGRRTILGDRTLEERQRYYII